MWPRTNHNKSADNLALFLSFMFLLASALVPNSCGALWGIATLLCICFCAVSVAAPSHGDLRLLFTPTDDDDDYHLVQLYNGPDGTDYDLFWGTLNGYNFTGSVGDTLCHQLGYDKGEMTFGPPDPDLVK